MLRIQIIFVRFFFFLAVKSAAMLGKGYLTLSKKLSKMEKKTKSQVSI